VTNLWLSFAAIGALLAAAGCACYGFAGLLLPPPANRAERASWAVALGLALLSSSVPLALLVHLPPRWTALALVAASAAFSLSRRERPGEKGSPAPAHPKSEIRNPRTLLFLLLLIGFGIAAYLIPSLSEPMWSNDFLGIWGFKGKAIFTAGAIPRWLFTDPSVASSHPEYPLGLPFLYAAISFVFGRWDDQAMAILFPLIQAATLLGLFGWLRRRGASPALAFAAAAVLANFIPLYSAFYAGLADVPYSFAVLLFGAAFADAVEGTDARAPARLALAAALAISTKNEGLLLAGAGVLLWLFRRRNAAARSRGVFLAIAIPAVVLSLAGRIAKGSLPLRDFDFGYLGPTMILEFLPRVAEALHSGFREVILPSWAGILCLAALIAAGRHEASGYRMLALAGLCFLAYLLVPAFAVLGPEWLIRTSLVRTTSALAPLVAAAVAIRLK
jgi:hypothetical protein